jgi:hypothetical protein
MSQKIRDQIVEQVDRLNDPQQRQLLEFARRLAAPAAVPGRDLLRFSGSIDQGGSGSHAEGDRGRLRKG